MNSKLIWAGAWVVLLAACTSKSDTEGVTKSGLDRSKFETTVDGKPVKLYVLENQSGMEVCDQLRRAHRVGHGTRPRQPVSRRGAGT